MGALKKGEFEGTVTLEPSRVPHVAALKRLFELWALDKEFHDAYRSDPAGALASTGLNVDPRAGALVLLGQLPEDGGELPETFTWYRDFFEERFARGRRNSLRMQIADPRFAGWRARQMRRCARDMPYMARFMSHLPLVFELSLGCSVGCSFCALSAGRLEGAFRHTEANAALWKDVLSCMHAAIGGAAGAALCYYATEPLDNPDYELFLKDFHNEFGEVPQTTTAAATRDLGRTRELLRWGQQTQLHFDRLSLLGKRDADAVLASFTPEELLYTDLLPQFEEAPACSLKRAGRNLGDSRAEEGTSACASGFIVNMFERSVRLVTPVVASDEHPTGELVYEKAGFSDGASLEGVVRGMIERHMSVTLTLADLLGR
ncbi:MAG: radical SAM family RiPP maturation amino acid epimerase [Atopobiaceae bacterium]|nr:radical SAM family RiPP maturation amino acid epimerase [Atopobiaceae bacterium]